MRCIRVLCSRLDVAHNAVRKYARRVLAVVAAAAWGPSCVHTWSPVTRSFAWVTCATFCTSYVLFLNVPAVVTWLHQRPAYVDDLGSGAHPNHVDLAVSGGVVAHADPQQQKFKRWFLHAMRFVLALTTTAFVDYVVFRMHASRLAYFELAGVLGGVGNVYKTVQTHVGDVLLSQFLSWKRRDERRQSDFALSIALCPPSSLELATHVVATNRSSSSSSNPDDNPTSAAEGDGVYLLSLR